MKNILSKTLKCFIPASLFIVGFSSCNNVEIEETAPAEYLKSASINKSNYVVVLKDSELSSQLEKLKGYEKKNNTVKSAADKILKRAGITDGEIGYLYSTALQGFSVKIAPGQLKKLQDDPSVKVIKEDMTISLDPKMGIIKAGKPGGKGTQPSQQTPWGITRVGGPVASTGVAWIIDSGIDLDHPDLNVDTDRAAYFTRSKSANDDNGHGTHVAGTVAALDNNIGVIGVAPGATVVPVKVLDRRGNGSTAGVIAGVDYVAANASPGDVANMSLGGSAYQPLDDAVYAAASLGIKFALASGNESDDANNHSPARVNHPNIYTVSAMDSNDTWASFSNYGNPPVDYCAPGVSILSCYKDGGYATSNGTSMASPHVAGLLLLGSINADGDVIGDPDGNPDTIAHN